MVSTATATVLVATENRKDVPGSEELHSYCRRGRPALEHPLPVRAVSVKKCSTRITTEVPISRLYVPSEFFVRCARICRALVGLQASGLGSAYSGTGNRLRVGAILGDRG